MTFRERIQAWVKNVGQKLKSLWSVWFVLLVGHYAWKFIKDVILDRATGSVNNWLDAYTPSIFMSMKKNMPFFPQSELGLMAWMFFLTILGIIILAYRDTRQVYDKVSDPPLSLPQPPQSESLQIAPASVQNRLRIGYRTSSYTDERGITVHDIYLPVFNTGVTDSFMVQIVSITPSPPEVASLPWSVRWEDKESEFAEIVHDQERTLRLCCVDLTGETRGLQAGRWKPARIWFFTPKEKKETFLPIDMRNSDELYDLKVQITFRITLRSTEEKILWDFVFGFEPRRTEPRVIRSQPQ